LEIQAGDRHRPGDRPAVEHPGGRPRRIAQSACLVIGGTLVAAGVLGFVFGGSGFGAGSDVEGEDFIIFEVNARHSIVHLATGALLLFAAPKARLAVTALLVFAGAYAVVTIWGFIDGNDVINIVPVDPADNWLHVALMLAALAAALAAGGLGASSLAQACARRCQQGAWSSTVSSGCA
jgi:hypothetical protein